MLGYSLRLNDQEMAGLLAGIKFNCVLLNNYRDGNDSAARHGDKGSILGRCPIIAPISFGQAGH
jgi:alkylated DNA repair dioxygenase AlkB